MARNHLDYVYRLPETWKRPDNEEAAWLRALLVELTGPVVVRRLWRLAPFREHGIDFSDEARHD